MIGRILSSQFYSIFVILLILISVSSFVTNQIFPNLSPNVLMTFETLNIYIAVVFSFDYFFRVVSAPKKLKYIFSFSGLVDFISSIPIFIAMSFGFSGDSSWLRVIRLISLSRTLKFLESDDVFGGIFGKIIPYSLVALGFKALILVCESKDWWIIGSQFNMVLGVIGFSLAVLLGSKLSTVMARLYAIEDTICRIVGSMRDMSSKKEVSNELAFWSVKLENFLKTKIDDRLNQANDLRNATDKLEKTLEDHSICGASCAGFHRDVAFLIHRATVKTPPAFDNFLRIITILYLLALVIGIQGGMGVISSLLSSIILGGLYFLIQDIDDPLSYDEDSYIDARLDALEYWNKSRVGKE